MRTFASVLAGVAGGLFLGYVLFAEQAARHSRRTPMPHAPPRETAPPPIPAPDPPPPEAAAPPEEVPPGVLPPTEDLPPDAEIEEGLGRIVVDFGPGREPDFSVEWTSLDGRRDSVSSSYGGESWGWIDIRPGVHVIFWKPADRPGKWGARVAVEAGRVTRVDATDEREIFELPVPAGLGRLDVVVRAASGFALEGLRVYLRGHGDLGAENLEEWTDSRGHVCFDARPGTYVLDIGDEHVRVDIFANECVEMEVRPQETGELLFDLPASSPELKIRREEAPQAYGIWWSGSVGGRLRQGRFFLSPGSYSLVGPETPIQARVHPGRSTAFAGPAGGLRVFLEGASPTGGAGVLVRQPGGRIWSILAGGNPENPLNVPYLAPGTYRVQGCEQPPLGTPRLTEECVVEVGDTWVEVRLCFDGGG